MSSRALLSMMCEYVASIFPVTKEREEGRALSVSYNLLMMRTVCTTTVHLVLQMFHSSVYMNEVSRGVIISDTCDKRWGE